ncbi:MAG: efflux transporter outer membrane subunit [Planctomycetes bacterium]|nr:efflux transporter outer membrane subunit [Planctomycetota bacterium]
MYPKVCCLLVLAGCAVVGEEYVEPQAALAPSWDAHGVSGTVELERWWTAFDDPELERLIESVRARNLDLASAAARVREARATLGVARAAGKPSIDAGASFSRTRQSLDSRGGAPFLGERETSLWDIGFDARWELDVFGGARRDVEAALADLESVEEQQRATLISLCAETARAYVELRGLEKRLSVVRARVEMQEQLAEIVRVRADAGVASDLDASRVDAQVASSRAELPLLEARMAERVHALAVLCGSAPSEFRGGLGAASAQVPEARADLILEQPLDLLRRRPDLRAAERRCAAASARTASALAARYPRVSLGASFGWLANDAGDLLKSSALAASLGPSISLPLFDAGARRARFEAAGEREAQAVLEYRDAVLGATKEVEDALAALAGATQRRATLRSAVEAQTRAASISRDLYASGVLDFSTVLDTERELLALQDQLAQSEADCALQTIALAKALGGGWDPAAPPTVAAEASAR